MNTIKRVLRPERLRQVPEQFSWLDQAFVQRHFIDRCCARTAALYLFLVTVADAQGLSYYSHSTLAARLRRRSLIVVFSEFTDPTSAELMIESMRRLVERHRVIFVVMADAELAEVADKSATSPIILSFLCYSIQRIITANNY